jgi:hypothetical protein
VLLPFSAEQFFEVFRRYNEQVWPAQLALNALALLATAAAWRALVRRSWTWARVTLIALAGLWAWSGIVFFKMFFASMTRAGELFGTFFVLQAAFLLLVAWMETPLGIPSQASVAAGLSMLVFALVLYPILGLAAGQRYPAFPTFGAPCPLVILTLGVFCLLPALPRILLAVPLGWALLGATAATAFHVTEDFGLPLAALVTVVILYRERRRSLVTSRGLTS